MLSPRENALEAIRFGNPEYVPNGLNELAFTAFIPTSVIDMPLFEDGKDAFGVKYTITVDGSIQETGNYILDDVTEWKEVVKFPDMNAYPWAEWAAKELEPIDREKVLVRAGCFNGVFDRLMILMGYEEGLMAMVAEPEACSEFFSAVADHKIAYIEKIAEYYQPDIIHYMDDLAHAKGLFMSPDMYRKLIKPHHKRVLEAITSKNILVEQHCCGKCEEIVPDFVEMGATIWYPAQISNDLKGIKERFHGKLAMNCGFDSQGPQGLPDVTDEVLRTVAREFIDNYAQGGGLIASPIILGIPLEELIAGTDRRIMALNDEILKYSTSFYVERKKTDYNGFRGTVTLPA